MKTPFALAAFSFFILHFSSFIAAAAEAAAEGVQLWEDGPFWADRNIGAEDPWEPGLYFWWGDTLGYRWENGRWVASDGSASGVKFHNTSMNIPTYAKNPDTLQREGWTTADDVLAPERDAARAKRGGEWRMPTKRELEDLRDRCDWTWTATNGVSGFVVRGRGDRAAAAVFLPAAGYGDWNFRGAFGERGFLWAADPHLDGPPTDRSWRLQFGSSKGSSKIGLGLEWNRTLAMPVRPVRGAPALPVRKAPPAGNAAAGPMTCADGAHTGVRLWEGGPYWADRNVGAEAPWEEGWFFWWGDAVGYRRENDAWVAVDGSSTNFSFNKRDGSVPVFRQVVASLRQGGWITNTVMQSGGWTVTNDVLSPAHDPARVHWGGSWRMPTRQDLIDLGYGNKCDWTWTVTNGVAGFVVRGRGDYAAASIFLPASGLGNETKRMNHPNFSEIWASDPRPDIPASWRLSSNRAGANAAKVNFCMHSHWDRFLAAPVRPIRE